MMVAGTAAVGRPVEGVFALFQLFQNKTPQTKPASMCKISVFIAHA
jgi:hypothetical protein